MYHRVKKIQNKAKLEKESFRIGLNALIVQTITKTWENKSYWG